MPRLALAAASAALSLIAIELALRTFPALLPRGVYYGSGEFDPDLGFRLPDQKVYYNKVRYVERIPNRDGFLDIDHERTKPPGIARVGFFGDSYVESVQVPLEQTFFRRLDERMGRRIEALAFGLSGLGTLHAMALYEKFAPLYEIDLAVYCFVNNDPSDHFKTAQDLRSGIFAVRPTALPTDDPPGHHVFQRPLASSGALTRTARWIKDHVLLSRVVYAQVQLWSRRKNRKEDAELAVEGLGGLAPDEWPAPLRADAERLTRSLIVSFRDAVTEDGVRFAILYVPDRSDLEGATGGGSWRAWLTDLADDEGIPLVDPTDELVSRRTLEGPMYDDHWTLAGHGAIAAALASRVDRLLEAHSGSEHGG